MFARVLAFIPLAILVSAAATPPAICGTSTPSCCNSTAPSNSSMVSLRLTELGLGDLDGAVTATVDTFVGLECSDIVGNGDCSQEPVCCEESIQGGIINVGCSPINIL